MTVPFLSAFGCAGEKFKIRLTIPTPFDIISSVDENSIFAGMAELADAHGSVNALSVNLQIEGTILQNNVD